MPPHDGRVYAPWIEDPDLEEDIPAVAYVRELAAREAAETTRSSDPDLMHDANSGPLRPGRLRTRGARAGSRAKGRAILARDGDGAEARQPGTPNESAIPEEALFLKELIALQKRLNEGELTPDDLQDPLLQLLLDTLDESPLPSPDGALPAPPPSGSRRGRASTSSARRGPTQPVRRHSVMEPDPFFERQGYPKNTRGEYLDPETEEPLTEHEMACIKAMADPATQEAFEAAMRMKLDGNRRSR